MLRLTRRTLSGGDRGKNHDPAVTASEAEQACTVLDCVETAARRCAGACGPS
jgi:hypothetical protein